MNKYNNQIKRKLVIFALVLMMIIPLAAMQVFAVNSKFILGVAETKVNRGDEVVITVTTESINEVNGGFNGYSGSVSYDSMVLSREGQASSVSGWNLVYNPSANTLLGSDPTGMDLKKNDLEVFTLTFKVLENAPLGSTTIDLSNVAVSDSKYKNVNVAGSSITLTIEEKEGEVKPPAKSSNNNLDNLTVSEGTLSPKFSSGNSNYTVKVGNGVSSITIGGSPADGKASIVKGLGNHLLKEGSNTIEVIVKAEDGSEKKYTITVEREASKPDPKPDKSSNSKLDDLTVSGGKLSPKFDPNNKDYTINVGKDTDKITIDGITDDENATIVKGLGDHQLKDGKNVIDVVVRAEDGTETTYQIIVEKESKKVDQDPDKDSNNGNNNNNNDNSNTPNGSGQGSSNNYVLNVQGMGDLNKEFSKEITHYVAMVGRDTESVNPVVSLEDKDARYELIGHENLKIGDNEVILRVTAANGDVKDYVFNIHRSEEINNALLASLQVGGYAFNPGFRSEVNYYSLTVPSNVSALGVSATPKYGGSTVNITGHDRLEYGVNYVKVSVNGDDMMNTYMVEIIREREESRPNLIPWIISGVSLLALMFFVVSNHFNKKIANMRYQSQYYTQPIAPVMVQPINQPYPYSNNGFQQQNSQNNSNYSNGNYPNGQNQG